jgi:uncharacterized protein (DUF1501 family)
MTRVFAVMFLAVTALGTRPEAVTVEVLRSVGGLPPHIVGLFEEPLSFQQAPGGAYYNLMATLDNALGLFYTDLNNQGLLNDTLLMSFSEFGRRISENGSTGTDHGAGSVMILMGGRISGGLYGTAPSLNPDPSNPTLENNSGDVKMETDFRSVYARVIDNWLGASSVSLLGGDFRKASLTFV